MMKDMVNDNSTLQVGDILAEFFVKKMEEMEEAETNDSSDSDSDPDSKFCEKRKEKKTKKKKHKHKKSKKKSKHGSKHKHSHKTRKRKHKDDESKETQRHCKRHKPEDYEEKSLTSIKEEDTAAYDIKLLNSDTMNETVTITTGLQTCSNYAHTGDESTETNIKLSERILQTSSSAVKCNSPKNRTEQKHDHLSLHEKEESEYLNFQISDFEHKNNFKNENSNIIQDTSQTDDKIDRNFGILRRNHNDKGNIEHTKSINNESCTNNVASSVTISSASDSISSLPLTPCFLSTSTAKTDNSNITSVTVTSVCTSNMSVVSNSNFTSNTQTFTAKSRGKIVIKDLSCCQILQQISEKEKIVDSLEEGEITSEEEFDVPKEESLTESSEENPFYKLDIPKEKKPKKKREKHKHKKKKSKKHLRRSRSNDNERRYQHERKHLKTLERPRSSSPSEREPYDLREKIDKARLLKVAQKNVLMMIEQGTLPKGVKIDALKQEQLMAIRTGGKSVQELTDFCRALSQKDQNDSSSDASQDKWNEDVDMPFIHHPFKLREHQPTIKLNIKNAIQLPIKSPAEKVADAARLRTQFPVSSGSQHRIKELQWIPVEKDEKPAPKQAAVSLAVVSNNSSTSVVPPVSSIIEPTPQPAVSTVSVYNPPHTALPTAYVQPIRQNRNIRNQDHDISIIVAQRLRAVRRLQENENDIQALNQLYRVQKKMQEWILSKQLPGQYTGSTDVRMLSPEELSGPVPVWVKKDQFSRAMPVTEGIGMHLLRKMGWNPGEGLGKNKEGVLEPLLLDIKTDKRGLISDDDVSKKILLPPIKRDLSGKHPVSVLMELCSKRKWGLPVFELIDENGPDHRKTFLFKVRINNVEYQPTCSSPNKKHAKAQAATVCLQALGLVPRDLNNPL